MSEFPTHPVEYAERESLESLLAATSWTEKRRYLKYRAANQWSSCVDVEICLKQIKESLKGGE